jgi:hypothetical protein
VTAAWLAFVLVVAAACGGQERSSMDRAGPAAQSAPAFEAEEAMGEAPADGVAAGEQASQVQQATLGTQKLIFEADMQLRVDDPAAAVEEARSWVEARGGFLEHSSISESGGQLYANATLRIPQEHYDDAREHLRGLAEEVLLDNSQRRDVTAQYADMQARLDNLEAAEDELRELLSTVIERGGNTEDILRVHQEITNVRGQIDSLRAQLDALSEQVALSTIRVEFSPTPVTATEIRSRWQPGQVLRTAWADLTERLQGLADFTIYFTIAVLPVVLILAGMMIAAILVFRRLRGRLRLE